MNASGTESVSRKTRAETLEKRTAFAFSTFLALNLVVYVLHEHANLISLNAARWAAGTAVVFLLVAGWRIRRSIDVQCKVCGFKTAQSKWKYCPGCATEIDQLLSSEIVERRKRWLADQTLGNLYASDTMRIDVRRSKRLMYAALAIFVLLVFLPMPFYFVGPFVEHLALHWYWFFFGGMVPFGLVSAWQKLRGVRCRNCRTRFNDREQSEIAHGVPKHGNHWRYCAYCAHPIDKSA
jgi:hypothetical protein